MTSRGHDEVHGEQRAQVDPQQQLTNEQESGPKEAQRRSAQKAPLSEERHGQEGGFDSEEGCKQDRLDCEEGRVEDGVVGEEGDIEVSVSGQEGCSEEVVHGEEVVDGEEVSRQEELDPHGRAVDTNGAGGGCPRLWCSRLAGARLLVLRYRDQLKPPPA